MTRLARAPEAPLPELAEFFAPSNYENALIKVDTHTKPEDPQSLIVRYDCFGSGGAVGPAK
jgi:hypothetical protein